MPAARNFRMLLPLGVVATLLDMPLAADLHSACDSLPLPPAFVEGAARAPASSAPHMAQCACRFVQKGLDFGSIGAVCQTDMETFYDKVDVVRAAALAAAGGASPAVVAAAVRVQLLVQIRVRARGAPKGTIGRRTTGPRIGSRVAGALGRFVVRELAAHLWRTRRACGSSVAHPLCIGLRPTGLWAGSHRHFC